MYPISVLVRSNQVSKKQTLRVGLSVGRLLCDPGGLAHQVVEEVGVPLLGGDVARVEEDGQAQGLQVLRIPAPALVVKVHLERVVVIGGDAQDLGVQSSRQA